MIMIIIHPHEEPYGRFIAYAKYEQIICTELLGGPTYKFPRSDVDVIVEAD